ncbi:hypothetical protein [Stutzerimonas stutzeri]|uniref:hypothetical protein n=1 Tax=Stutzerimonas stutzeri TaxID=316 RepID=UPI003013A89C|nr:hypothetical protein [Stutzerimonas stutzeri]MBK3851827.1 hypothetical protein [Stutzerimonas stutzeri]
MDEIDSLTREKIREWQIRRLDIKEQMHLNPSKTLELSRVLDLMDEEHAELLSGSKNSQVEGANQREEISFRAAATASLSPSTSGKFDLQLHLAAKNAADLGRLLEMAVCELQYCIEMKGAELASEHNNYLGGMSGTLGNYEFVLDVKGEDSNE